MSPGKMIRILSGLRRKPGRGYPFLDLSPGDGGRESPVGCLLLSEVPAVRLAAERLRRRRGRCGGRTKVPSHLPTSVGSACCPPGREAASAARGPLRRRDGGPPVGCLLLLKAPAVRLAAWRLCRREAAGVAWLKAPLWKVGRLRAPPVAEKASKKEWQWSKFCER